MFTFLLANLSLGSILAGMFSVGINMTAGQVSLLFIVTFFLGFFLGMLFEQFRRK
jgi:hypothetical protein